MEAGQSGPNGRSVARSVEEEEFRFVSDPAVTQHLNTGGRSVRERYMILAVATIFPVST